MEVCIGKGCLVEKGGRYQVWQHVGGWCSNSVQGPYGVCLWKSINKGWTLFVDLLALRWGRILLLGSSMINGVRDYL